MLDTSFDQHLLYETSSSWYSLKAQEGTCATATLALLYTFKKRYYIIFCTIHSPFKCSRIMRKQKEKNATKQATYSWDDTER